MWMIVQHKKPDDFVLATGETHAVREFVELSFAEVGRKIKWKGKGVDEVGIDAKTGKVLVEIDPRYFRPTEVDLLLGDPRKARKVLGWKHKTSFRAMVKEMVTSDFNVVKEEARRFGRND
jgi:GDPmannose 4,6-dehydratase